MRKLLLILAFAAIAHGEGRQLAPRPLEPTAYRVLNPAIAYGGDRFLTIWREDKFNYGTHVLGAFTDVYGKPLGVPFTIFRSDIRVADIVSTGDAFYLFVDAVNALEMIQLDLNGREVLPRRRIPFVPFTQTRVAWNGTHFLAVGNSNVPTGDANGVLFTRTGEVVRRNIRLSNMDDAEIVPTGDDFVVLIANRNGLFADRVDETGAVSRTMVEEAFGFVPNGYRIPDITGVTRDDGSVAALWSGVDWRGYQLKAAVIAPDGTTGEAQVIATSREQLTPLFLIRGFNGFIAGFSERQFDSGEPYQRIGIARLDANAVLRGPTSYVRAGQHPPVAATGLDIAGLAYLPPNNQRPAVLHRTIDGNATTSHVHTLSIAPARQLQPLLGAGGGYVLAAFTEIGDRIRARAALVGADGEPLEHRQIGVDRAVAGNELAWSGTEYLALVESDFLLFAQRLSFDGEPIGNALLLGDAPAFEAQPSVAWAVDRWVVVWPGEEAVYFATVSPAGILSPVQTLTLDTPLEPGFERNILAVSVAAEGARVLITWIEGHLGEYAMPPFFIEPVVFAQRFRRDGRPIDAAPARLAVERAQYVSSVAGENTFAVVTDADTQTTVTLLGSRDSRVLATRVLPPGLSDVAWDGDEYIVAARYWPDWPRHITLSRFDEQLHETQPVRGIATLAADIPAPPSVAAVAGQAVVAIQEGDAETGARAVVYREADMTALPSSPPKRRSVRR
jgi:hypothetical protein